MKNFFLMYSILTGFSGLGLAAVTVENSWVRPGKEGLNTAIYFDIKTDEKDLKLMSAESQVAERTELHTHIHDQGVMRMRKVDAMPIPGTLSLKPGGDHVMLITLTENLCSDENQVIPVTLTFSNGYSMLVDVPVKAPNNP